MLSIKAGTLVTQMVTDADGYAKVTDLYPGYYRLHEKYAPLGYKLSSNDISVTVNKNTSQYLKEQQYEGTIQVVKTFGEENVPEAQAVFEVYDSKNNLNRRSQRMTKGSQKQIYFLMELTVFIRRKRPMDMI